MVKDTQSVCLCIVRPYPSYNYKQNHPKAFYMVTGNTIYILSKLSTKCGSKRVNKYVL